MSLLALPEAAAAPLRPCSEQLSGRPALRSADRWRRVGCSVPSAGDSFGGGAVRTGAGQLAIGRRPLPRSRKHDDILGAEPGHLIPNPVETTNTEDYPARQRVMDEGASAAHEAPPWVRWVRASISLNAVSSAVDGAGVSTRLVATRRGQPVAART